MQILLPPLALVALTLFCIGRLGYLRYGAVRDRQVDIRYYERYEGFEEPAKLRVHSRHVSNLFETPVLFYAITLIAHVSGQASPLMVVVAWVYVALRLAHTWVHLTSNVVLLRFRLFAASLVALAVLWLLVTGALLGA